MRPSIQVANYGPSPFYGWRRTTIDRAPAQKAFRIGVNCFVYAGQLTPSLHLLDCLVQAAPGSITELMWSDVNDLASVASQAIPSDPVGYFGIPRVDWAGGSAVLGVVSTKPSGVGWAVHFRARIANGLVADLYALWLGGAIIEGELTITASDPRVRDLVSQIPNGLSVRFGPSTTVLPTGFQWATAPGDGVTLAVPVVFIYSSYLAPSEVPNALAIAAHQIRVVGSEAWPNGNPIVPRAFNALAWNRRHLPGAFAALSLWEPEQGIGPNKRSGDTGAQADQVFCGGETATPAGAGSELTRYLSALWEGRSRPCNYRENDGSPLELARHPGLLMWDGRPDTRISQDMLGKTRQPTDAELHYCGGPDVEHANIFNLAVAYRLTGKPALQQLLVSRAKVYLSQQTFTPGISTSQPYASRAIGIEGINAYLLWHCLEDRGLAQLVRNNWIQRWRLIVRQSIRPDFIMDVRTNDPRLGAGEWWLPWQQAYGAYGLDLAGELFDEPTARAAALECARKVVNDAYLKSSGIWLTAPVRTVATVAEFVTPDYRIARATVHADTGVPTGSSFVDMTAVFDGSFNLFGMPMAPSVILRHDPHDAQAAEIIAQAREGFDQLVDSAGYCWIPPEVTRG